jgi:2-methylisocitrate lyase-like PEP mutase family enzyme
MLAGQREQAFHKLHERDLLLLPNAWDAGSARLIESRGAKAIATTSAGLAWSTGYQDGGALPVRHLVSAVRAIAHVIHVPLSIDIEHGYSDEPADVGILVAALLEAGIVGVNIEDGLSPPQLLCAKIAAARQSSDLLGSNIFINVRTDVYLRNLASNGNPVTEVARRAALYRAAGCNGIFVPGLRDDSEIEAIASAIDPLPLNIMLVPGLPSNEVLCARGVRRLSAGSAIAQAAFGRVGRLASQFLQGRTEQIFEECADYEETNELFESTVDRIQN